MIETSRPRPEDPYPKCATCSFTLHKEEDGWYQCVICGFDRLMRHEHIPLRRMEAMRLELIEQATTREGPEGQDLLAHWYKLLDRTPTVAYQKLQTIIDQLTIAIRVCMECNRYLGVTEWAGRQANADERWCVTHSLCDECFEADPALGQLDPERQGAENPREER